MCVGYLGSVSRGGELSHCSQERVPEKEPFPRKEILNCIESKEVERSGCSSGGPRFDSQLLHSGSPQSLTPVLGGSEMPSLVSVGTKHSHHVQTYEQPNIHEQK